ncbi:MAG: dihydroorotate dehydrogenase electron transfer subunit [candidate division KSB1 bacterium]|nr:dihydroorotate dehydrogenase electron transfer subunit [candidate division KSB1 bacterium]
MPDHFKKGIFSCPVLTNHEVARGIFLMRLRAPEMAAAVWPGQFVNVKVSPEELPVTGHWPLITGYPLLRRPFSVCQVDRREGTIDLIWKVIGPGTALLARHQPQTRLSLIGPLGRGFELPKPEEKIALVAGGLGIAPMPILAMELTARGYHFEALIAARTAAELWGERELAAFGGKVRIATDDGSAGEKGFGTKLLERWLEDYAPSPRHVLACGPMPMLAVISELCREAGAKAQLSIETMMGCGFGICMGCPVEPAEGVQKFGRYYLACLEGPVFPLDTIRL